MGKTLKSRPLSFLFSLAVLLSPLPARAAFTNGQAADLVLGQSVYNSNTPNNNPSGASLNNGSGIFISTTLGKTFVADYSNNRVLIFHTTGPVDGASADIVLGQPDMFRNTANYGGGVSAFSLSGPISVFVYEVTGSTKLFVTDRNNNRVLIWNAIPSTNTVAADVVVGQSGMNSGSGNCNHIGLSIPRHSLVTGGKLYVSDQGCNRIKIYNTIPNSNGAAADLYLGQTISGQTGCVGYNTHSNCSSYGNNPHNNATRDSLWQPQGVWVSTTLAKTFVADLNNNRVLIYNSSAPVLRAQADLVLGQPDFESNQCNTGGGVTAGTMCGPSSIWTDDTRLVVNDEANHRVLIWNSIPTSNQQNANVVVGQANMSANSAGSGAAQLNAPMHAWYDAGANQFFIADWNNHRVVVRNGFPAANGSSADYALGQNTVIGTAGANQGGSPSASTLRNPGGVTSSAGYLWVADTYNYRVLGYGLPITQNAQPAFRVLGQPDFSQATSNNGGVRSESLGGAPKVFASSGSVYVADVINHRVLVWTSSVTLDGQGADWVVGQSSFNTNASNQGGLAANTLSGWWDWPGFGIWASTDTLTVADALNNRVLTYTLPLSANKPSAVKQFGQPGFNYNDSGNRWVSNKVLNDPMGMASDGSRLFVADYSNSRVVGWDLPITANGQSANYILGQASFTYPVGLLAPGAAACNWNGIDAQSMCNPMGVWVSSGQGFYHLYVGENTAHRVKVWTTTISAIPANYNQPAQFVIGQPMMTSGVCNNGGSVNSQTLCNPQTQIWGDKNFVWISDWTNHRILKYPLPVANNTAAVGVIGQQNMTTNTPFSGASPFSMNLQSWSRQIVSDGVHLAVVDAGNSRVMIWNSIPTQVGQGADFVLGQANMSNNVCNQTGLSAASMCAPYGVSWDGKQFFVGDTGNRRVLVWNGWPTSQGQPADYVIGQGGFGTNGCGTGGLQLGLCDPEGVYSDGRRLWVADWSWNRVMMYDLPITANQKPASLVLGQPGFATTGCNQGGISANTMCNPAGVNFDGERLYVADYNNHRVLVWNTRPTANGQAADIALGQPVGNANTCNNGGLSAQSLCSPSAVYSDGARLYVSEISNHRTLFWNTPPSSFAQAADGVLGQPNLNSNGCCAMTANNQTYAGGSFLTGQSLWHLDDWYHRVLRYTSSGSNQFTIDITSGLAPSSLTQSTTPVSAFKLLVAAPNTALTWTRATVYNSGALADDSVQVRLYKEVNGNGVLDPMLDNAISALVTMSNGKADLSFAQSLGTTQATYYLAVFVNPASLPYGPNGFPQGSVRVYHNLRSFGFAQAGVELAGNAPVGIAYHSGSFTPADAFDSVVFGATSPTLPSDLLNSTTGLVLARLRLSTQNDYAFMTSLAVSKVGTANDADIAGVTLYQDNNANGLLDAGDTNLQVSSSPFALGVAYLSPSTPLSVSTNIVNFLVVADFAGSGQNKTFGITIDTSSFALHGVDIASVPGSTTPYAGPIMILRPALPAVVNNVPTSHWWASSFTFTGNFGQQGVSYFRVVFDQSPTHVWTDAEPLWTSGTSTQSAASPAQNWYFHARAYNATNQGGGSVDIGPFWSDTVAPVAADYGHVSSTAGVISESQWDPLAAGVTVQATVRDANSGLAVSTAGVLTSLVGFWRMDNDWTDSSASGVNGAASGGPSFSGDAVRGSGAGLFNGAGNVNLGNPAALQITGSQTVAFWMKPYDVGVRRNMFGKSYGGEFTFNLEIGGSLNYYWGTSGVNGAPYTNTPTIGALPVNQWTHVALVRNLTSTPRTVRWYINGQLNNTDTASIYPAATASALNATIGDGYVAPFLGVLDDLRVFNRALPATEIGLLYNTMAVSYSTTAGNTWTTVTSTISGNGPYVGLTAAADGTTSSQTLTGFAIPLIPSTNTVVCNLSQTCNATNQVRFHVKDLAGNGYTYGPHSVLVDTKVDAATPTLVSPANGGFVTTPQPTFSWVHPSTSTFPGLRSFYLQVSSMSDFSTLAVSIATAVVGGAPSSFYASTTTLSAGTTYYWRVRVRSFGDVYGPYSNVFTFQTDFTGPAVSVFRHYNSTGGAFAEFQFNDLSAGVTAQVRVQDALTGLFLNGAPGAETVALWQFEENTGLTARSSSDGGNPGTLLGGASWAAGRQGRALQFDGVNGRFSVPHNPALTMNAPFTAQVWVKPNATLAADTAFLHKGAGNFGYYFGYTGGQLVFWVANGQALTCGVNAVCAAATLGGGSWQLVTGSYDGVDLRLYLNGQELGSTTYTGGVGSNTDPLVLGSYNGSSRFLAGAVDDARIYNVVRSAGEIAAEATAASPAMAMYSNDAGWTWRVTAATYPVTATAPYLAITGSHGNTAAQTFELRNIQLAQSTSSLVGASATNQVKFFVGDIGNNFTAAGPYGLLFDSSSLSAISTQTFPVTGAYVKTPTPTLIWLTPNLASIVQYKVQVDEDPAFLSPEIDIATPSIVGLKLATFTATTALSEATTYYWRVQARTNLNTAGPWSNAIKFVTDFTSPTLSAFQTLNQAGAPLSETQFNTLTAAVTAQMSAQDLVSGMANPPPLSTGAVIARLNFEAGYGPTVADGSGYGNHGTLSASNIWTAAGYLGGGVSFSGTQYVDISTPVVSSWAGLTVALWVRPTSVGDFKTVWASKQYQFIAKEAGGQISFYARNTAGGGCIPTTLSSYTASTWHHVVFTVDPGTNQNRIYVNGEAAASCTGAGTPIDTRFRLGMDGVTGIGGNDAVSGQVDSVVIATAPWNQGDARIEMARDNLYQALVSTTAGASWFTVTSTGPAVPRLELSGAVGSNALETLRLAGLSLNQSTNALTCGGAGPCGASNQVRFILTDRAGNVRGAGPYALLIDSTSVVALSTAAAPAQGEVVGVPTFLWNAPSTVTLSGLSSFVLEASPSPAFSPLVVSISTPAAGFIAGAYVSTYTLTEGSTYYWRVRAKNSLGNYSPYSATAGFVVDNASPSAVAFGFYGSTGGVLSETQAIDLFSGVTVQLRVQDAAGGLRTGAGFGFMYSTSAGQTWIEWGSTATALSGTGEARVNAFATFNGQLYAGTGNGAQVHRTPDGSNWSLVFSAAGETNIHALAVFNGKLYAASGGAGKVYSTTNGTVWNEVFSGSGDTDIRTLAVHNGKLYAGTAGATGKVFASSDGSSWYQVFSGLGGTGKVSMAAYRGRLWVGGLGGGGVYSTFDGVRWSSATLPDINAVNVLSLAVYDGKLWAGTGTQAKLFRSTDGVTWAAGPSVAGATALPAAARHRGRLFFGADDGKLYSTDGASTWQSFSPAGAAEVSALAVFGGKLYAGTAPGAKVFELTGLNESLTGADGATGVETVVGKDVSLVQSTNTVLCGGVGPCGATNQFRFMVSDRGGLVRSAGPYAILVDTVIAVAQPVSGQPDRLGVAVLKPEFRWTITPAISPANLTGYEFQLDTIEDFSAPVGSSFTANRYAALPFNLSNNTTYYWRVRAFDILGASSSFSAPQSVFVDASQPTGSAFVTFDSTGGAVGEAAQQDLFAGVTAQFTLYDAGGVMRDGPTVLAPSTGTELLWRLDDGAGTTLADAGPFARAGTTGGSPAWTNGRYGKGLRLTGLASGAATGPTVPVASFTLQLWLNTVSGSAGWIADSDAPDYGLYLNNDGTFSAFVGATQIGCAVKVNEGAWHHLTLTYDGAVGTVYADGAYCNASAAAAPGSPGTGFALGQQAAGAGPYLSGVIDEVRIFDRARTALEVSSDRDTGNPFWVRLSTDAGATWSMILSTQAGSQPYIAYTGADRDVSSQTVQVRQLALTASTNSTVCGGAAPCGASNQLRFYTSDRAGNLLEFGPYSVLVDSSLARPTAVMPADGGYGRGVTPAFGWTEAAAQYQHTVQVSTDAGFATITFSSTTFNQYLVGGPALSAGTTYYWRVRANSAIGLFSPFSPANSFLVDSSLPAGTSFRTISSTGGALAESQSADLTSGATVQLALSDTVSGLSAAQDGSAPGALGHWRFDEGSGVTAADSSGSGLQGSVAGDWSSGQSGFAFSASGGQSVTVPYVPALNTPSAMTVEAWVKTTAANAAADGQGVVSRWNGASGFMLATSRTGTGGTAAFYAGIGSTWLVGTRQVNDGQWHHLAATYDGASARLYVDGVLEAQRVLANGLANTSTALSIGGSPNDPSAAPFTGSIDDVRLYSVARSASQVRDDYLATPGWYVQLSTTAANMWTTITSTGPGGAYVTLANGVLEARGLSLAQSTSATTCGGVSPCGATNQVRFFFRDRAGNPQSSGPWAIVVDAQMSQPVAGHPADGSWARRLDPILSWSEKAAMPTHVVELSTSPAFATYTYSTTTAQTLAQAPGLSEGVTYYWRLKSRNASGVDSAVSLVSAFRVDATQPDATSYRVRNATGGLVAEAQYSNLALGATVQMTVQDLVSGLGLSSDPARGFSVSYTTNGGASWVERASLLTALGGTGENYVASLAVFNGKLYAGTSPGGRIYSSPDGAAWTLEFSGSETQVQSLAVFNGRLYAGTYPNGRIYSSVNGSAWSLAYTAPGQTDVRALAAFNGKLYAGTAPGGLVYATTDGSSWQAVLGGTGENAVNALASFQGRLYAATAPNAKVYRSADGFAWSSALSGTGETEIRSLAAFSGSLYAGSVPGGRVYKTSDGAAWSAALSGTGESAITSLASFGGRIYAGTNPGAKLFSSADGANWQAVLSNTGETYVYSMAAFKGDLYAGTIPNAKVLKLSPLAAALTGADGTTAAQTLSTPPLDLVQSTHGAVCGGAEPCAATNQVRFAVSDAAGNTRSAGPFAVLVDTSVPQPLIASLTSLSSDSIRVDVTPVVDGLSGLKDYQYMASTSNVFAYPVSTSAFIPYSTFTFTGLQQVTTYYVRVVARDNLLNLSPYSLTGATSTIGVMVFSSATLAPAGTQQGTGAAMLRLTMNTVAPPSALLNKVAVRVVGGADADLTQAELWSDADASGAWEQANDVLVAAAPVSGGLATIDFGSNVQSVGTSPTRFFVVFRVAPTATIGASLAARIEDNTSIGFANPYRVPGVFPATSSSTVVQDGPNIVLIDPTSSAPGTAQPNQSSIPMLRLRMRTDVGTSVLSKVVLHLTGSAASNEVAAVRVYRDNNANGAYDAADGLVSVGNDVFVAGVSTVNFTAQASSITVSPLLQDYFVLFNLAGSAVPGNTVGVKVATGTAVALTGPDTAYLTVTPATSTLVDIVQPNVMTVSLTSQLPSTLYQGAQYSVLKATVTLDVATSKLTGVSVNRTGTALDSDVSKVSVYLDGAPPAAGGFFNPGLAVLLGTAPFSSGRADVNFAAQNLAAGTTYVFFVVYDLSPFANTGANVGGGLINNTYLRVSNPVTTIVGNFPFTSSTGTINPTVNQLLVPTALNTAPGGLLQGATNIAMLRLDVRADQNAISWTSLTLDKLGTAPDSDVSAVTLYEDANANQTLDVGTDTLVTSGLDKFVAGAASLNFPLAKTVNISSRTYFVALSIKASAYPGSTIGVRISTSSAFSLNSPNVVSTTTVFPISGGPAPINQYPNQITVTTTTVAPASANPGTGDLPMLKLVMKTDVSNALWQGLRVDRIGGLDADVAAVKVYYDINQIGSFNQANPAQYLLLTSTPGSAFGAQGSPGTINLAFSTTAVLSPTPQTYFVVMDLSTAATPTNTIAVRLLNQNYFTVNAPNSVLATTALSSAVAVATPPSFMYVTGASSAPASAVQGATNVPLLALKVRMGQYTAQWSGLTVVKTGSALDSDISRVKVYRDANGNGALDSLLDTLVGTGTFTTSQASIGFSAAQTVTTSTDTYFIACDLSGVATANATFGAVLNGPGVFAINSPNGVVNSGFPAASSTTVISPTQTGVFITAQDRSPASLLQGATAQVMLGLTMNTTAYTVLWNTLQVTRLGTASDSDISAVRVYKDNNANGQVDATDTEITSGNDRFVSGTANIVLGTPQQISVGAAAYLVAVDVYMFSATTSTFGLSLGSAAAIGVASPNWVVNSGFPITASVSPLTKRPDTLITSWTNLTPSGVNQGQEVAMARFIAWAQRDRVYWSKLKLLKQGTLNDGFLNFVRVYRDNGNSLFDASDTVVATGTFAAGIANLTFSSVQMMTTSTQTFIVTFVFDPNSTVGATIGFGVPDASYLVTQAPDAGSGSGLPFNTSSADVLDARTPTMPLITLDGPFWKNFEDMHFKWTSSVGLGSITDVQYAIGTTPGASNVRGYTSIVPLSNDFTATGLTLQNGVTYYISMKAQSSFGFISPTGESAGILVDLVKPGMPGNVAVTKGVTSILINWSPSVLGPSGLLGYLVEYRPADRNVWLNAKTGKEVKAQYLGQSLRAAALSSLDLVTSNSYSWIPPGNTVFVRVSAVSGSGVVSPTSDPIRVVFGVLPKDGVSQVSSYPNPFDSRKQNATINYTLSDASEVTIQIFSIYGAKVAEMTFPAGGNGGMQGANAVTWDGSGTGGKLPKGVYLAVISGGGAKVTHKIGLIH